MSRRSGCWTARSTFIFSSRIASDAGADGRLHRQDREHLQQVVLHHVAHGAEFLVEPAAALDAELLGHRDLHVLDVRAVPDRLDERVGEAEVEQVLHRLLAEEMVDAEDRALVEHLLQRAVDGLRARRDRGRAASRRRRARWRRSPRCRACPPPRRTGSAGSRGSGTVDARRRCACAQGGERGVVAIVAVDVAQFRFEAVQRFGVGAVVVLREALAHPGEHGLASETAARRRPRRSPGRRPRRSRFSSAGKIFLNARSPVMPKTTSASELSPFIVAVLGARFATLPSGVAEVHNLTHPPDVKNLVTGHLSRHASQPHTGVQGRRRGAAQGARPPGAAGVPARNAAA